MTSSKKDFDYILDNIVGVGKRQWLTMIALYPLAWTGGYPLFLFIFSAYLPKHRCYVPSCDGPLNVEHTKPQAKWLGESWLEFAVPREETAKDTFAVDGQFDSCKRYIQNGEEEFSLNPLAAASNFSLTCSAEAFNTDKIVDCNGQYVFDDSVMSGTIATEFEIACNEDWKTRLLGTILMCGLLVGSLIGGRATDRFGRKKIFVIASSLVGPIILAMGFSVSYEMFAVLHFFACATLPVIWISTHTYILELFSPKYRPVFMAINSIPFNQLALLAIVHYTRHWVSLQIIVGVICIISIPTAVLFPESPRWMAGNGRVEEAIEILYTTGRTNKGQELSDEDKTEIRNILSKVEAECEPNLYPWAMFYRKHVVKTLIAMFCWVMACLGFYALTFASAKLSGDVVVNYLYLTVIDIPMAVFVYYFFDRIGRRYLLAGSNFTLAVSCLAMAFIPKSYGTIITIIYLAGRTAAGLCFMIMWTMTAELYPTNLRSQAIGICSMVARFFGLGAAFITKLSVFWKPLPLVALGIPYLVATGLAFCLSETANKDLPQNMREAEELDEKSDENQNQIEMQKA